MLDDEGKNLILRKIAGDYERELKVLRGNIRKLGYISEIKSVLSEFVQYDIGEEEIRRVMEETGERTAGCIINSGISGSVYAGIHRLPGRKIYYQGRDCWMC